MGKGLVYSGENHCATKLTLDIPPSCHEADEHANSGGRPWRQQKFMRM
jgi:hypothetical protein